MKKNVDMVQAQLEETVSNSSTRHSCISVTGSKNADKSISTTFAL